MVTEKGEEESVAKTMTIKVKKVSIFLNTLKLFGPLISMESDDVNSNNKHIHI